MRRTIRNLLRGAATILEIAPGTRTGSIGVWNVDRDDAEALRGDWERVGKDLEKAIGEALCQQP
ncbi:hypothetical protein LCGC14_1201090 [marine sediment metagenome]|uniref:Uncharacterized protein n=1 Tax=marine sediment metagenome TaxID=412755 RepID=A0A0F9NZ95_9ZZZZ